VAGRLTKVFGNEAGDRVKNVKTAWETAVLRAHGVEVERTRGKLPTENRAKLAEIDLNFHDLRHEAGSRKLEAGWPLHAVSVWLGHTKISTTEKYLNVKTDYLHELNERVALTIVRARG
jgi:integrase